MKDGFLIRIPSSVRKSINKIPLPWRERIWKVIDYLEKEPFLGKKMKGKYKDKRKIRIWPYRIIYKLDKENRIIDLVEVRHKGGVSYG